MDTQVEEIRTNAKNYLELRELATAISASLQSMRKVGQLEMPSFLDTDRLDEGMVTEDAMQGYSMWMKAFAETNPGKAFEEKGLEQLRACAVQLDRLKEQRAALRAIQAEDEGVLYQYDEATRSGYAGKLQALVDEQYDYLQQHGKVVLVGGVKQHHEVMQLTKTESGYRLTTYNAGYEAEMRKEDAYAVVHRDLKNPSEEGIKDLLATLYERKLRVKLTDASKTLTDKVNAMLEPPVLEGKTTPQHKKNCTTRSTREWLKHTLDRKTFGALYSLVTQRDKSLDHIEEDLSLKLEKPIRLVLQHVLHGPDADPEALSQRSGFVKAAVGSHVVIGMATNRQRTRQFFGRYYQGEQGAYPVIYLPHEIVDGYMKTVAESQGPEIPRLRAFLHEADKADLQNILPSLHKKPLKSELRLTLPVTTAQMQLIQEHVLAPLGLQPVIEDKKDVVDLIFKTPEDLAQAKGALAQFRAEDIKGKHSVRVMSGGSSLLSNYEGPPLPESPVR